MTIQEINQYHTRTKELIAEGKLAGAIGHLSALSGMPGAYGFQEELDRFRHTYGMMLHYFVEGYPDDRRRKMSEEVAQGLSRLNDRINYRLLSETDGSDYFVLTRSRSLTEKTPEQIIDNLTSLSRKLDIASESDIYPRKIHDDAQNALLSLFNRIWTIQFLNKEEREAVNRLLTGSDGASGSSLAEQAQCDVLGALYLGCMQYYDPAKVKLIIAAILNNRSDLVLARAYTLLVILLAIYRDRISSDRTLRSMLALAADGPDFIKAVKTVIVNLIRSIDTQKINKTIAEEIIPGIIKLRPDLERSFRKMEHELDSEEPENNPAWEELLSKTGLEEKLRRLNDMQMEGGDMFMMAFARMKSMPFFRHEANWFIPFDGQRTEVHDSVERMPSDFADLMASNRLFCHTDCYSMFLGLGSMPESAMKMMSSQIKAQMSQFDAERKASFADTVRPALPDEIGLFVKDLYRFYHQFVNRGEFRNPFDMKLDFGSLPVVEDYFSDSHDLQFLGTLYFKRRMWENAISSFSRWERLHAEYMSRFGDSARDGSSSSGGHIAGDEDLEADIANVLEMKGYALMNLKDYKGAIETFSGVERYKDPSAWALSKIAECYRHMGDNISYEKYLDKALELDPDDKRLLLKRSRRYMEASQYDKAVGMFYKLNYLDPGNALYVRLLAWCRCLQGEPEKALRLYTEMPEDKREISDILNAGHCHFALGDYTDAVKCYREYIDMTDADKFVKVMDEDASALPFLKGSAESLGWVRDAALMPPL